jgi:hypothetical protein
MSVIAILLTKTTILRGFDFFYSRMAIKWHKETGEFFISENVLITDNSRSMGKIGWAVSDKNKQFTLPFHGDSALYYLPFFGSTSSMSVSHACLSYCSF